MLTSAAIIFPTALWHVLFRSYSSRPNIITVCPLTYMYMHATPTCIVRTLFDAYSLGYFMLMILKFPFLCSPQAQWWSKSRKRNSSVAAMAKPQGFIHSFIKKIIYRLFKWGYSEALPTPTRPNNVVLSCSRNFWENTVLYWIIYRVRQKKVIPCRIWLISQQRIWIFIIKFTRLFCSHIYI